MTVKVSKAALNLREELADLRKPSSIAGEALLRADSVQEQRDLINAGRKNLIINGGFDVWQYGNSYTTSTTGYGQYVATDRWGAYYSGTTISKQTATINDTLKNVVRVAATGSTLYLYQVIESGSALLANKTISYSYWARANKNTTISGENIGRFCGQNVSSQSSYAIPVFSGHEVSTEWRKITNTVTLTDDSVGQSFDRHFFFVINISTGVSSGDWIEIAEVQLELGSVATDFEHRSYGEELALCQRYYQRLSWGGAGARFGTGIPYGTTQARVTLPVLPVFRMNPTITYSSLDIRQSDASANTVNSIASSGYNLVLVGTSALDITLGVEFRSNAAGHLDFDAEL